MILSILQRHKRPQKNVDKIENNPSVQGGAGSPYGDRRKVGVCGVAGWSGMEVLLEAVVFGG